MPAPTTDLVAIAWLKSCPDLVAGVASTLPGDVSSWAQNGFVQVSTVGGSPNIDVPLRMPVVQVDCWAANPNSTKPPWGKANSLAEIIVTACQDNPSIPRLLALVPDSFGAARVLSAYALSEPRRITDDDASFARYNFQLQLNWVAVAAA